MGDSFQRLCSFVAGILLVVVVALVINISTKQGDSTTDHPLRQPDINETTLSHMFQATSSKACLFLTAMHSAQKGRGTLRWQNPKHMVLNKALALNDTQVTVYIKGFYLVFVQATFKMNCSKNLDENLDPCSDLTLTVNHHYQERSNDFSAVFYTHCPAKDCGGKSGRNDIDVVLSKFTLLWMQPRDSLSVSTSHMDLVDYSQNPTPTFLTVFKYSD